MNDFIVMMINSVTLQPVLPPDASPMRVTVRETSKLTNWPVEDGTQRTDHRVLDPIEIDLPLLISSEQNRDIFDQLRQIYLRGDDLTIQTKLRTYESMMIFEMPHDETSEVSDAYTVEVKLKQVITIKPEFGKLPPSKVADKKQSSTVKKGGQQTSQADAGKTRKASTLYRLAN